MNMRRNDMVGTQRSASISVLYICALGATITFVALLRSEIDADKLLTVCRWVGAISVCNLAVAIARRGWWKATTGYHCVFWLFHFGLISLVGLGLATPQELAPHVQRWLLTPQAPDAAIVAVLGALGLSLGAAISELRPHGGWRPHRGGAANWDPTLGLIGLAVMGLSVVAWLGTVVASGGLRLVLGSYREYLDATGAAAYLEFIWLGIGIGAVILAAAPPSRYRTLGWSFFVLFAVCGLPLGLRGEILFPAVAGIIVRSRRGQVLSGRATVLMALVVLGMIAGIRGLRQVGVRSVASAEVSFSALEALAEMGASLHPVQKVLEWEDAGDDYIRGASYWAPIDRALTYVIPGHQRIPARSASASSASPQWRKPTAISAQSASLSY
jgi:hypothetical protein